MASSHTRLLSSQPDAYSRAFQRFLASCDQEGAILKCIQGHIMPIITDYIPVLLENGSPIRHVSCSQRRKRGGRKRYQYSKSIERVTF